MVRAYFPNAVINNIKLFAECLVLIQHIYYTTGGIICQYFFHKDFIFSTIFNHTSFFCSVAVSNKMDYNCNKQTNN
jgi:hypothetical protein